MEKTYLNLIQGIPDIDDLQNYAHKIENRLKYSVSRELKYMVYVETPEGYYASEHEIIWMHMLLSWGYSLQNNFDRAAVEAKKAALLLEGKSKEGRFDDPMIRIVLGVLWAMCDRWEDARVDFRVAGTMDPSLKWASAFAGMDAPPEHISLILTGTGPEVYWDPKVKWNPVRGLRDMKFQYTPINRNIQIYDQRGRRQRLYASPDSSPWYRRHIERDNAIHKAVNDSKYGGRVLFSTTKGTVKATAGITAGILLGTFSVIVGGAVIYAGVYYGSAEAVAGGIGIMGWGVKKGHSIGKQAVKRSVQTAKRELDVSANYRFVRFLPSRAFVSYGNGTYPMRIIAKGSVTEVLPDVENSSKISIRYIPSGN